MINKVFPVYVLSVYIMLVHVTLFGLTGSLRMSKALARVLKASSA